MYDYLKDKLPAIHDALFASMTFVFGCIVILLLSILMVGCTPTNADMPFLPNDTRHIQNDTRTTALIAKPVMPAADPTPVIRAEPFPERMECLTLEQFLHQPEIEPETKDGTITEPTADTVFIPVTEPDAPMPETTDADTIAVVDIGYINETSAETIPEDEPVREYEPETMPEPEPTEETAQSPSGLVRENCTDRQWNDAVSIWNRLPEYWRSAFAEDGWTMIVTNNDFWTPSGYAPETRLAGLTMYDPRIIYIRADCTRIEVAIFHEIGHYADSKTGFPSCTDEFYRLYESEKDTFQEYRNFDNHGTVNTTEYFATIWMQLYLDPASEESAPESFAFVRNHAG